MNPKKFNEDFPNYLRSQKFLNLARDFYHAYKNCMDIRPLNAPKYFLGCHAVELALKSYLLRVGVPVASVVSAREYGHDIERLIHSALERGLDLGDKDVEHIILLSAAHSQFWNRYPIELSEPIYVVDQNDAAIENLINAIDPYYKFRLPD